MDRPRIFIVDDEKDVRAVIAESLNRCMECDIQEASDGKSAMEAIVKDSFDLILLDIKMPGASGIDILKKMKDAGIRADVIMLSAWDSSSVAIEAIKHGAVDYITKPAEMKAICEKAAEALKKRNKFLPKK